MTRYKTKPFEIDAFQWDGREVSAINIFFGMKRPEGFESAVFRYMPTDFLNEHSVNDDSVLIQVFDEIQNTWVTVNPKDYIIKGMKGEYYPCEQEVFETKYEEV